MVFEIMGTRSATGKRVKARVEAATRERAVARLQAQGIVVDADSLVPSKTNTAVASTAAEPSQGAKPARFKVGESGPGNGSVHSRAPESSPTASAAAATVVQPTPAGNAPERSAPHAVSGQPASNKRKLLIALGTVAALLILRWAWSAHMGGESNAAPPPAEGNPAASASPVPSIDSEEIRRQRTDQASMAALNEVLEIDHQLYPQFDKYNVAYAEALHRHYSGISLIDVDVDLRTWIGDVLAAAKAVLDTEQERQHKLSQLDSGSTDRAQQAALRGAELGADLAAQQGKSAKQQVGSGILAGATGALLSTLDTELRKKSVNDSYDKLHWSRATALKDVREKRSEIKERLVARYGWTVITGP